MSVVQIGGVDHAFLPLRTTGVTGTTAAETLPLVHTSGDTLFPLYADGSTYLESSGENRAKLLPLALKSGVLPLNAYPTFIDINRADVRGSYFKPFSFVTLGIGGTSSEPTPPPTSGVVYPVYR